MIPVMTPLDSIRYYKYFVRSAFMVEDPHNGYVKAYVGGPDFRYFKYDAANKHRRNRLEVLLSHFFTPWQCKTVILLVLEVPDIPQSFDLPGDSVPWQPKKYWPAGLSW